MEAAIEDVLSFWFGDDPKRTDSRIARDQSELWWGKNAETDRTIKERFGELHKLAAQGGLEDWTDTPRGRLALIIVLDQFSRNIHRDTADAFAQDALALAQSLQGQGRDEDLQLRPVERVFFYMPLEHAESLPVQDQSVIRFEQLLGEVPEDDHPAFEYFLDFARRHRDIILRFDRFPHRNAILERQSTPAEEAFLQQPGSSF